MRDRIIWIDYAKMICIFLMVCGHAGLSGIPLTVAYQFHMPVFFIVSGMLFRPKGLIQTIKCFGIPILFYGILYLAFRYCLGLWQSRSDLVSFFSSNGALSAITAGWFRSVLFVSGNYSVFPGDWFVLTLLLIQLSLNLPFFRRFIYPIAGICFLWCCIQPFVCPSLSATRFIPYFFVSCFPFFATGVFLREHHIDPAAGPFWTIITGVILFGVLTFIQGRPDMYDHNFGLNYSLFFVNACLGCYILASICSSFRRTIWVETLSTGTLLVLGIHGILISIMGSLFSLTPIPQSVYSILIAALVLCICYYPTRWLNQQAPLLLGKAHK